MFRPGRLIALLLILATAAAVAWPSRDRMTGSRTLLFTVWGAPFEDTLFADRYARHWEVLYPDVKVDYRRFGDDITSKYNAWHTRGRGADVMRVRITDYHGLAARGLLMPLDDFLAPPPEPPAPPPDSAAADQPAPKPKRAVPILRIRPGLMKPQGDTQEQEPEPPPPDLLRFQQVSQAIADIPSHLRNLLVVDGLYGKHIYALPEDNAQYGLFYNRALFLKHNQEHPNDLVNFPPADGTWTWEDLRQTAIKLTRYDTSNSKGQPRIIQAGLDFAVWAWPFMTFFVQAGGELWSEDGLTCTINSLAGVETLEYFRTLQRTDRCFNPSLSGYLSGTGADALFATGRTAMLLDGSWRVPNLERDAPKLDFAVAPLPSGKYPGVVCGCVLWAISADARYPAEAWDFLSWLLEPEQAIAYWEVLRVAPPASTAALESPRFRRTPGLPRTDGKGWEIPPMSEENFELRAAWMRYATVPHPATGRPPGFVPVHTHQTELEEEITRMLNEWLNPSNKDSAQKVLDAVADHMHRIIDRDRRVDGLPPVKR